MRTISIGKDISGVKCLYLDYKPDKVINGIDYPEARAIIQIHNDYICMRMFVDSISNSVFNGLAFDLGVQYIRLHDAIDILEELEKILVEQCPALKDLLPDVQEEK